MKIAVGNDHLGCEHKSGIIDGLEKAGCEVIDMGCNNPGAMVDYTVYAKAVAQAVSSGQVDRGVLVCGSGHGCCIAANKYPGVRAVNCPNITSAHYSRLHTDANVLCIGAWFVGTPDATVMAYTWFDLEFEGGRHQERVDRLEYSNEIN